MVISIVTNELPIILVWVVSGSIRGNYTLVLIDLIPQYIPVLHTHTHKRTHARVNNLWTLNEYNIFFYLLLRYCIDGWNTIIVDTLPMIEGVPSYYIMIYYIYYYDITFLSWLDFFLNTMVDSPYKCQKILFKKITRFRCMYDSERNIVKCC